MAFRDEVYYVESMQPGKVRIAAEDCSRVVRMMTSALPALDQLPGKTQWNSVAAELYEKRLGEAIELLRQLQDGYARCASALREYADTQQRAREAITQGVSVEGALGALITPILTKALDATGDTPMRQWADLRESAGFFDWLDEKVHRADIDKVRGQAEVLFARAGSYYDQAIEIEARGRAEAVDELGVARRRMPDFLADTSKARNIIVQTPGLQAEALEAGADPNARRPLGVLEEYQVTEDPNMVWYPGGLAQVPAELLGKDPVRMTETEARILQELPMPDLLRFEEIKQEAYDTASNRFPGGDITDNHNDAFRHTYWNALMVKEFGEDWASRFATAHEMILKNPAAQEAMDLHNNEIGRAIAVSHPNASSEELADLVHAAVTGGHTLVIDATGNLAHSDVVGLNDTGEPAKTYLPGQPAPRTEY